MSYFILYKLYKIIALKFSHSINIQFDLQLIKVIISISK